MIIADTDGLQQHVSRLMQSKNGDRLVAVAFIGKDALRYVPEPAGVVVYCWDNVAGTHPDGVEDLLNANARVKFVSRLHMKVFWSEKAGALIGSANLSNNALGDTATALFEAAYFTNDPSEIDIRVLRRRLERNAREITPAVLNAYRKRYFAAAARRDRVRTARPATHIPTFEEYARSLHRKSWILVAWDTERSYSRSERAAANEAAKSEGYRGEKRGVELIRDGIETLGGARIGDWVLSYEYKGGGKIGQVKWTYAHTLSEGKKPSALQLIFDTGRKPFATDSAFKRALEQFIIEKELDPRYEDIRLSNKQMRELLEIYEAKRGRERHRVSS